MCENGLPRMDHNRAATLFTKCTPSGEVARTLKLLDVSVLHRELLVRIMQNPRTMNMMLTNGLTNLLCIVPCHQPQQRAGIFLIAEYGVLIRGATAHFLCLESGTHAWNHTRKKATCVEY